MKVNVLEKSKNELKIEIVGENHSFCNAIHSVLLRDDTVEFVGYNIAHPLVANPTLYVRTKGKRSPEKAIIEASKTLGRETEEIIEAFNKALKSE
jgi:DNA-directed RNA polymerase subunit L